MAAVGTEADDRQSASFTALWLGLCLLVTAAVYARSLSGELVYDDRLLVDRNPYIADLSQLPKAFTHGLWDFLEDENTEKIAYWRPLTATTLTLVRSAFGLWPVAYHLFSLVTHLLATAVAFFLARRLTSSSWIAGFTALFFGLHPTHVESVAWISALNDPLFGLFSLLSILTFLRWRDGGSRGTPVLAALAFGLGLLAKEMAASTVLLLLALDLAGRRSVPGKGGGNPGKGKWFDGFFPFFPAYLPFAIVLAFYMGGRMLVFDSYLAGFDRITTDFRVELQREWLLRLELLGGSIELLAAPLELNLFRPFRPFVSLGDRQIVVALGAIGAFAFTCYLASRFRWRRELFALLAIPAGLFPILISIQSLGRFPLSDRFLYVPVFGFVLYLALLLNRLPRPVAWILALPIALFYGYKSYDRSLVWQDEVALFERTAEQSPRSVYAQWGLGRVYLEKAQQVSIAEERRDFLNRAFVAAERGGELLVEAKQDPATSDLMVTSQDYLQTNLLLAWCYIFLAQEDPREGYATPIAILEQLIERVSELEQQAADAAAAGMRVIGPHHELEKLYTALGVAQRFDGRDEEAGESFRSALALQPSYVEAHLNYGYLLFDQGDFRRARARFEKALELKPDDYGTRLYLCRTFTEEGRDAEAERLARGLHEENPGDPEPLVILGSLRLRRGDASDALTWLERATRAEPKHAHAWYLKGKALIQRNAATEAIASLRNAIKWGPTFENNYDLGAYLLNAGALEEALPYLVSAFELAPPEHAGALRQQLLPYPHHTADTLFRLGKVDMKRGQYDTAESFLNRSLELRPAQPQALFLLSRLLQVRGRHTEALDTMARAVTLAPEDFSMGMEYALYLLEQGRFGPARDALERTKAIGPPTEWEPGSRDQAIEKINGLVRRIDSGEAQAEWKSKAEAGE